MTNKNDRDVKEIAIKFLKDKQKKLVKNFQTDIFSLEQTGEYEKYKTDDNFFKALNLSEGIDEILKDCKVLEIIKKKCLTNCNLALVKDNFHYENYCKEFEYFLNKYNESPNGFEITKDDLLIQQEFELIKEWLSNVES